MKCSNSDIRCISKVLHLQILRNTKKTVFVEESIPVPQELLNQVKKKDQYLIEALLKNPESILVSTDQTLVDCLKSKNLRACLRDTFLQEYLLSVAFNPKIPPAILPSKPLP
jgi:hypothetical protein